jgi:homospermidine synthase
MSIERMCAASLSSPVEFEGRVVIVGCGSIGQGILPVIGRHIPPAGERRQSVS